MKVGLLASFILFLLILKVNLSPGPEAWMFDLIFAFQEESLQYSFDLNDFEGQNLHANVMPLFAV